MEVRMSAFGRHGLIQDPEFFLPLFSYIFLYWPYSRVGVQLLKPWRSLGVGAFQGDSGCYIPRDAGTLRGGQGRLRSSAIRPLGRCKAGHISVPCPHKPLETLQATMPEVNFTRPTWEKWPGTWEKLGGSGSSWEERCMLHVDTC